MTLHEMTLARMLLDTAECFYTIKIEIKSRLCAYYCKCSGSAKWRIRGGNDDDDDDDDDEEEENAT